MNLNDILAQDAWKERFIKRERAFFSFIKYWVGYVDITLQVSKDIHWRYFPGYNRPKVALAKAICPSCKPIIAAEAKKLGRRIRLDSLSEFGWVVPKEIESRERMP